MNLNKKIDSATVAEYDNYYTPKAYVVEKLPDAGSVRDFTEVFIKNSTGGYDTYRMVKGSWVLTNSNLNTKETVVITGSGGSATAGVNSFNGRTGSVVPTSGDYTASLVGLGNVTNDKQLKEADLDTDADLTANSDTKIPSQKAVKTYVDKSKTISKLSTESRNTTVTLADDSDLVFTTEANSTYLIELFVSYNISSTPGMKFAFAHSGTTTSWLEHQLFINNDDGITSTFNDSTLTTITTITSVSNIDGILKIKAILDVGSTGGTFSFQWSQNTSDASNTTVNKGSYLKYIKL